MPERVRLLNPLNRRHVVARFNTERRRRHVRRLVHDARPDLLVTNISIIETFNEVTVARCVGNDGQPLITKISHSERADRALLRHYDSIEHLDALDTPLNGLVPEPVHLGHAGSRVLVIETALPGQPMTSLVGAARVTSNHHAFEVLKDIHGLNSRPTTPNDDLIRAWVGEPIERLVQVADDATRAAHVERLDHELRATLSAGALVAGRIHGDFAPANILTTSDGLISGVVDWENSRPVALPEVDLTQFSLFACQYPGGSLGDLVEDSLRSGELPQVCSPLGDQALQQAPNNLPFRAKLLLAWLTHVSDNLRKKNNVYDQAWFADNVTKVLDAADATR